MSSNDGGGHDQNRGVEQRLDRVTDRLDRLVEAQQAQGERLDRLAEGQIRGFTALLEAQQAQGERLDRLAEGQIRGFTAVVDAIGTLGTRLDNVLLGPLGETVRSHDAAIRELRERVGRLEGAPG